MKNAFETIRFDQRSVPKFDFQNHKEVGQKGAFSMDKIIGELPIDTFLKQGGSNLYKSDVMDVAWVYRGKNSGFSSSILQNPDFTKGVFFAISQENELYSALVVKDIAYLKSCWEYSGDSQLSVEIIKQCVAEEITPCKKEEFDGYIQAKIQGIYSCLRGEKDV